MDSQISRLADLIADARCELEELQESWDAEDMLDAAFKLNTLQNAHAAILLKDAAIDALRWALDQIEDSLDPDHQEALQNARAILAKVKGGA